VLALEAIVQALRTIRAHPYRTILTMLCVVWGTASVIFLMSWGAGLNVMVEHSFEKIGKNMILAFPGHVGEDFTPAVDRRYLWFTLEDVEAVRKRMRLA
jgi:putative ABC transport system permease protein